MAEDADLDQAAALITWGALRNSGLGCISLEVAHVVDAVFDELASKITAAAERVHTGSSETDQIGPIPLPTQIPVIRQHIEDALARGAKATVGGPVLDDSRYLQPTILVDVPQDALVATEETFGPVLALVRVEDTDEAVALVNSSPYGLGSSVFSREQGPAIASKLRVGMTSVNDAIASSRVAGLPFGGRGHSGFCRKHGDEGLREFAYPPCDHGPDRPGDGGSSFERPAGAVAAALAATVERLSQQA